MKPTPAIVQSDIVLGSQAIVIESICKSGTQSRKQIDSKTVADIRSDIRDSNPIEPIIVFFDGKDHWVGDGYHRLEAHVKEKRDLINGEVRPGSKDVALRFNIESNASADQTRWSSADKRNAVTMLLESHGSGDVTRKMAQEIGSICRASHWLVETVAEELLRQNLPMAHAASQSAVSQALTPKPVREQRADGDEDETAKTESHESERTPTPNGRRSVEKTERDEHIAALVKEGLSQIEIAKRLGVVRTTVTKSLNRQRLTPETANPLVKVLERAQLAASEWESIVTLFRDGNGAAASWPTATREQRKEVIEYVNKAIQFQKDFINRLNKEAKG